MLRLTGGMAGRAFPIRCSLSHLLMGKALRDLVLHVTIQLLRRRILLRGTSSATHRSLLLCVAPACI
eukprot:9692478-Alexandrium_andersonii.AAC.1